MLNYARTRRAADPPALGGPGKRRRRTFQSPRKARPAVPVRRYLPGRAAAGSQPTPAALVRGEASPREHGASPWRRARRAGALVWAASWSARQARPGVMRVARKRARADPAALIGCRFGRIPDSPANDQEEPNDRDLQEDHKPDEGPSVHLINRTTRSGRGPSSPHSSPHSSPVTGVGGLRSPRRHGEVIVS
jgi:hypothetical protein